MEELGSKNILIAGGLLSSSLDGYQPRQVQEDMALAVEHAIAHQEALIVEAGTGTGKTFAYLIPALLCGLKVIVSTGTRNLQDQLYTRDLPFLKNIIKSGVQAALLKGRSNYLCPYRLEVAKEDGRFQNRETVQHLEQISRWAKQTSRGDIAEIIGVPEDAEVWPLVTSTGDNCLGQECPMIEQCPVLEARRLALEADILVVNHHLFFADMALKEEGFGELLPGANVVIFDEAHQVPAVAAQFFGTSISSRQLVELARDATLEASKSSVDVKPVVDMALELEHQIKRMRLAMGEEARRAAWAEIEGDEKLLEAIKSLKEVLSDLEWNLGQIQDASRGLEACWQRATDLGERFKTLTGIVPEGNIHWFETYKSSFHLHFTPIYVDEEFQKVMSASKRSWIFTSATLAVKEKFDHFQELTGTTDATTVLLESPFDFQKQSMLYLPEDLPEPSHRDFTDKVVEAAIPVINAAKGRTFFLFTSHRALQQAAQLLEDKIDYPILQQGTSSRHDLLNRYRELGNAVLLGTGSFWEGIDVRGEALSCVIIDKLPFASPGDPVVEAKITSMRSNGKNPFTDFQLPSAIISLKQGVGRLIRDVSDRGVLVLCDTRLINKSYGKLFIESLPPMMRTRKLNLVEDFFNEHNTES